MDLSKHKFRSQLDDFDEYLDKTTLTYPLKAGTRSNINLSSYKLPPIRGTALDDTEYIIGMELPARLKKKIERLRKSERKLLTWITPEEVKAKILASFVPDDIIYNVGNYSHRKHEICLLFGDVSGFTDLSEKYNQPGSGGASKLTQVLNTYIGSMVQEIMCRGGDIFKFSGDAFLAFWKVRKSVPMQEAVHESMDAALVIQKRYGQYHLPDVGVTLRVKLAISAGEVDMALIGTETNSHYVVVGQPVWDAKIAEKLSSAGEVTCSPTAWQHINPGEYIHTFKSDHRHVNLLGFGPLWRPTASEYLIYEEDEDAVDIDPLLDPMILNISDTSTSFMIRPAINTVMRENVKDRLRCFILPPVEYAINNDQPMDYLTEMRQVVVMFVNVVPINKSPGNQLIELVNSCYIITCKIIKEFEGGLVNKLSLFDKDLMIVIIFGLRGFIREFESQIALRAGAEIRHQISKLPNQKSVSVAVTTGMTYCGVVGHTLRREYSVIGTVVNKAARLMCAYEDTVSCDKDTFLQSKMETKNFTLLKHKELKGLHAVGPVYSFKEIATADDPTKIELSKYPLIGCDHLMRHYFDILLRFAEHHKNRNVSSVDVIIQNVLIYKGEARQGKTRLLDELLYLTPSLYNVTRVHLLPRHQNTAFSTVSLTMARVLGLNQKDSVSRREAVLRGALKHLDIPQLLCSLNEVFNVQFELSELFLNLPDVRKNEVRGSLFQQLLKQNTKFWVVIVDNLEYTDNESWVLLPYVFESDFIFYAATLGNRRKLSEVGAQVLNHPRVLTVKMPRIDNWYHAALACQILDVSAIPLELEKIIQNHSEGNPGWIESFMLSLIQSGGLHIRTIRQREVISQGLVIPPEEQMLRLSADDLLLKIKGMSFGESEIHCGWPMFQNTFRSTITELNRDSSRDSSLSLKFILVAMLPSNFNPREFDTNITMDVMVLMIFDSLNVFEQMVCKVSAVLGESFESIILKFVLENENDYAIAKSIQKLFEINVLRCSGGNIMSRISNEHDKIICYCENVKYTYADLPKYAFCQHLMFKMNFFRETIYSSMTDSQRKDFHTRAFNYLQQETRQCKNCGGGYFHRILGGRENYRLHTKKVQREKPYMTFSQRSKQTSKFAAFLQKQFDKGDDNHDEQNLVAFYGPKNINMNDDTYNFCTPDRRLIYGLFCPFLPRSKQAIETITRSFTSYDFKDCECSLILMSMYTQVLDHCLGAEMYEILMDVYIEFATACIAVGNQTQAIHLLTKAKNLLIEKKFMIVQNDIVWRRTAMLGKINTTLGYLYIEKGQIEIASVKLNEALNNFGCSMPTSKSAVRLLTRTKRWKLKLIMNCLHHTIGSLEEYEALFCEQLAECLCAMCRMYQMMNLWDLAELASTWALICALKSDKDFFITCTAYTQMLNVAYHFGRHGFSWWLEKSALVMVANKRMGELTNNDLSSVAKLYFAIFESRIIRCELVSAINMGYKTLRISETIQPYSLILYVLPELISSLIVRIRIDEVIVLLKKLSNIASEDNDDSAMCWYYTLSLSLALDTGYTLVTFQQCEKFYHDECDALVCNRDPDSERAFYACMWLWCIRNSEWEAMSFWEDKIQHIFNITSHDSIENAKSAVRVLEGLIIKLVTAMESKNLLEVIRTRKIIKVLSKSIEKSIKRVKIIRDRYYMLKAYLTKVECNDKQALKIMKKCKKICIRDQSLAHAKNCEHQIQNWNGILPPILYDLWLRNASVDNLVSWNENDIKQKRIICYTFRLPNR